jgi:hypothetical protein
MRSLGSSLVVLLTAVTAASSVAAQHQSGSTGSRVSAPRPAIIRTKGNEEEQNLVIIRDFARCTYSTGPKRVAEALLLPPEGDPVALGELASSECLASGTLKFSSALFRGALFGELYRQRHERSGRTWSLPVEPLSRLTPPSPDASTDTRRHYLMLSVAECLDGEAPTAVRDVVLKPAGSAEQKAAFDAILPLLGTCVPQGVTLKLNRMSLEHAFGEYLYRAQVTSAPAALEAR